MSDCADPADTTPAPISTPPPKTNSYYYWHGHEKERAKLGDVAPKTSPMLVKSEAFTEAQVSPLLKVKTISKYSWCNNTKSVSVYVDVEGVESLPQDCIKVEFDKKRLSVEVKAGGGALQQLILPLSKEISPATSSFRLKPNQIVIKLDKAGVEETWFDLVGKAEGGIE